MAIFVLSHKRINVTEESNFHLDVSGLTTNEFNFLITTLCLLVMIFTMDSARLSGARESI